MKGPSLEMGLSPKKSEIIPPLNDLLLFTGAALTMNLSAGPANFYVMARASYTS